MLSAAAAAARRRAVGGGAVARDAARVAAADADSEQKRCPAEMADLERAPFMAFA